MTVTRILIATDFSARSDRALRRAVILAKAQNSALTLIHVVDDDQPESLFRKRRDAAYQLVTDQAQALQSVDGVSCESRLFEGSAFEGIARAVEEIKPDLVVIGPHRRQALKDVFIGTTAERTIRLSRKPVVMASGVPIGNYRHVLVAIDLSESSAQAVRCLGRLGLDRSAAVSVVYVYDAPARSMMGRASIGQEQIENYLTDQETDATENLSKFLATLQFKPVRSLVKLDTGSVANVIKSSAERVSADLLVVGTHGKGGIKKLFLGSVAQDVLHTAECDVLVVPPSNAVVS